MYYVYTSMSDAAAGLSDILSRRLCIYLESGNVIIYTTFIQYNIHNIIYYYLSR